MIKIRKPSIIRFTQLNTSACIIFKREYVIENILPVFKLSLALVHEEILVALVHEEILVALVHEETLV